MNADPSILLLADNPVAPQTYSPVPDNNTSDFSKGSSPDYAIELGDSIRKY